MTQQGALQEVKRVYGDLLAHEDEVLRDPANFDRVLDYFVSEVRRIVESSEEPSAPLT